MHNTVFKSLIAGFCSVCDIMLPPMDKEWGLYIKKKIYVNNSVYLLANFTVKNLYYCTILLYSEYNHIDGNFTHRKMLDSPESI